MLGFLFSGQGSQSVGMGKSFYEADAGVRDLFEKAEQALDMPIKKYIFEGPEETLTRTDVTQPAICLVSLAALRMARAKGLSAVAACGHSLGEYAALVAAGALDEIDALRVVAKRGRAMQAAADIQKGKMAAVVGLNMDSVRQKLGTGGAEIAAHNAPDQIVLSGAAADIDAAVESMKAAGAKNAVELKTSGAWHSRLMEPAKAELRNALQGATWKTPRIPVVANATAEPFPSTDLSELQDLLVRQLTSPIRFVECLHKMRGLGVESFVELGPGKVLRGLVKRLDRSIPAYNIEDLPSLDDCLKSLSV